MTKLDLYLNTLKQAGHRVTPQRHAICSYLAQTHKHPTPYEVYADLVGDHPDISRATVYNTLNTLQTLGAIVEINFGDEHKHYETDPSPHINLICLSCHKIVDYQDTLSVDSAQTEIKQRTGFHSITAKVDVLGFCQQCQKNSKTVRQ